MNITGLLLFVIAKASHLKGFKCSCHVWDQEMIRFRSGNQQSGTKQVILRKAIIIYSRSQSNINWCIVITKKLQVVTSYSIITNHNLPQSMPNVGIIFKMFVWKKKHEICKIVAVIRSANASKILNSTITVKLNCT